MENESVLSGWATGLIGLTGIFVAPSAGSLYAKNFNRFRRNLLWRGAIGGTLLFIGQQTGGYDVRRGRGGGELFVVLGVGFILGHSIYDIFRGSRHSVEKYNEALDNNSSLSLTPWVSPEFNVAGLSLNLNL